MIIMKLHRVVVPVILFTVPVASCGPNLDDVNLSGCMTACNGDARTCLDQSDAELGKCAEGDKLCQQKALRLAETCMTTCIDCISNCVKILEEQIKE